MRDFIMSFLTKQKKRRSFPIWSVGLIVFILTASPDLYAKSYKSTFKEYTRHKELYSFQTMKVAILVNATFFSPEFRDAHTRQHIKKKHLEGSDATEFAMKEARRQETTNEFFVAMYAPKPYKDFSTGKETFWDTVITTKDGREIKPISIEMFDSNAYTEVMFPYVNRWTKTYRVIFPKEDLGKSFTLSMRSPIGDTHLKWD